jgi:hypothetical protein
MADLKSARFAGDGDLTKVLNGGLRLGAPGTAPFPAPVLSSGPAVAKVQQALIDIGFPMPSPAQTATTERRPGPRSSPSRRTGISFPAIRSSARRR